VKERRRSILHVDLDPFVVSIERSLDPGLCGRPVIVGGGTGPEALVAAASAEARALGVRPGQTVRQAQRLCPEAVLRPGDLETYGRFSDDVASIFQSSSRRVERPSADEAYLDLTPESGTSPGPVAAAESIKDQLQRRLGLDASLGLASSRLAARVASTWAKPRGLLLVLPGYEASFVGRQPLSFLTDLPLHLVTALEEAGLTTLGQVAEADEATLGALVGPVVGSRLRAAARGDGEDPIPVTAPPTWVQEEAAIRDRRSDASALRDVVEALARRAARRLRPFDLAAEQVSVEVRRPEAAARRSEGLCASLADEDRVADAVRALAEPLVEPAARVRSVAVRLSRLRPRGAQTPLFPGFSHASGGRGPR
jgi:DNA polymerase-4